MKPHCVSQRIDLQFQMFYNGIIRFLNQRVHGERLFTGLLFLCFQVVYGQGGIQDEKRKVVCP